MLHVTGSVHLDVNFDGYKTEPGMYDFQRLLLTSDVIGFLPLFELSFADPSGQFKKMATIKDGMPISINVGQTLETQNEYKFRLFRNTETTIGQHRLYRMTGYLDVPSYMTASSTKSYKDTSSNVIKQIVEASGFTETDIDSTADSQVWYQANKRNMMFVKYLCERGYIDEGSAMVRGVRFNKKFFYKDFNRIAGDGPTFAYNPADGEAQIVDHHVLDSSGAPNMYRGYGDKTLQQDMMEETPKEHKDIKVEPRADQVGVNTDIKGMTENGRVDITPPHFKDMAHENYFKAKHQNVRAGFLNSAQVWVLCPMQVDAVDLFMPAKLRLANVDQSEDASETIRDGQYVVVGKDIIVEGINYGERFKLARAGNNEA